MVIAGSDKTTRRRALRRQRDPSVPRIGPDLLAARQRLGLSLETIQDRTGVRRVHLQALEEDDLSPFPDEKTALVAVRRFAEVLGLDAPAMAQIVGAQWLTVSSSPAPVPAPPRAPTPTPAPARAIAPASVPPDSPAPARAIAPTAAAAPTPEAAAVPAPLPAPAPELVTAGRPVPTDLPDPSPAPAPAPTTGGVAAHLSRYPGDTSHLKAFTQTAQVPQVGPRTVRPSLPPGLRFDSTDSLPVTRRSRHPYPAPVALRVAVWTAVVLLTVGAAGLAVHHWRPAWLAKIHLVASSGAGGGHSSQKTPPAKVKGPLVTQTSTSTLSAAVNVRASVFEVVVTTQAPCWIHVTDPASFAPVFEATVPAGTTKTFTSGDGQLSLELGASHATVTVQILNRTVPGWSLTPSSAPFVVNFHSVT